MEVIKHSVPLLHHPSNKVNWNPFNNFGDETESQTEGCVLTITRSPHVLRGNKAQKLTNLYVSAENVFRSTSYTLPCYERQFSSRNTKCFCVE